MSVPLTPSIHSPEQEKQARRGLFIYFVLLIPLSSVCYVFTSITRNLEWTHVLMFMPAVSSIIARLALRDGVADVSFRLGGRRGHKALLVALLLPVGVGLLAYGIGWITGLTPFTAPPLGTFQQILPTHKISPVLIFFVSLLLMISYGTFYNVPFTLGEELGWRGYMLTRLIDAGLPKPILISGLIWGIWHVPLVVTGMYLQSPFLVASLVFLMINATALTYILARLRLATGSIWPCVLLHASWNAVIQGTFDLSTTGPMRAFWVGESGIVVGVVLVAIAFGFSRGCWTMIRQLPKRGEPAHEEVLPPALI